MARLSTKEQLQAFSKLLMGQTPTTPLFEKPLRGTWQERFQVHADGFWARVKSSLEDSYPRLVAELDVNTWNEIGSSYITALPDRSSNLNLIGDRLPEFLEFSEYPLGLIELARFERSVQSVFEAFEERQARVYIQSSFQVAKAWKEKERLIEGREYSLLYRQHYDVFVKILSEEDYRKQRDI